MDNSLGKTDIPILNNNQANSLGKTDIADFGSNGTSASNDIPMDVRVAKDVTGQHDFDGYCESAVENWMGLPNMGTTAANAFYNWSDKGKVIDDYQKAPAGSLIYFAPDASNQYSGHVGINEGNGMMMSATYGGVREDNINEWINSTGQSVLGAVQP